MAKNKISKKIIMVIMSLAMLLTLSAAPIVRADTVEFNVTPGPDPLSKKTHKADNEQYFYVTGTYFSKTGTLTCVSIRHDNNAVKSNYAYISPTNPSQSASYKSYASPGYYYYMSTLATPSGMNVRGRYTP